MEGFKLDDCKEFLNEKDLKMLEMAEHWGYKGIAVSVYDETVKESHYWSKQNVEFLTGEADEKTAKKGQNGSWPAVWEIGDKLDISAGCGNSHQRQLNNNHGLSKVSYRKTKSGWRVHGLPHWIYVNTIPTLNKNRMESTDDHIENVKAVYGAMRSIRSMIEKEGEEAAFKDLVGKVGRWETVVREAANHVSKTLGKTEASELLKPESLKSLLERLKNHKTHVKFGF